MDDQGPPAVCAQRNRPGNAPPPPARAPTAPCRRPRPSRLSAQLNSPRRSLPRRVLADRRGVAHSPPPRTQCTLSLSHPIATSLHRHPYSGYQLQAPPTATQRRPSPSPTYFGKRAKNHFLSAYFFINHKPQMACAHRDPPHTHTHAHATPTPLTRTARTRRFRLRQFSCRSFCCTPRQLHISQCSVSTGRLLVSMSDCTAEE